MELIRDTTCPPLCEGGDAETASAAEVEETFFSWRAATVVRLLLLAVFRTDFFCAATCFLVPADVLTDADFAAGPFVMQVPLSRQLAWAELLEAIPSTAAATKLTRRAFFIMFLSEYSELQALNTV
ncbi:MAG: hypothetical protein WBX21_14700 [Aestuariivirga sp.]